MNISTPLHKVIHPSSCRHFTYRRRLPVIMVKLRMAQHIGDAAKFVEQGRILTGQRTHPILLLILSTF